MVTTGRLAARGPQRLNSVRLWPRRHPIARPSSGMPAWPIPSTATRPAEGGFRGVALWRLGAEDPDLWNVLEPDAWPAADYDPRRLSVLTAQKSAIQYGDGDVLRIVETPHDGSRTVWRDADGRYAERYGQLPSYYTIESSGGTHAKGQAGKVLCLTFDDGPDPRYTPAILDILRSHGVRATFFIIGANADQNIGLVKREYAE